MSALTQFHFLRPEWLWLLLPACALAGWLLRRENAQDNAWRRVLAAHLLPPLLLQPAQRRGRGRPPLLLGLVSVSMILALAGPAWKREPTPFSEDTSALVVVVRVSPEMLAQDVQPSRLQRAIQKIHDLLALRPGTRNALIAYAGSAHLVMPLTNDTQVIESFAAGLDPAIMPLQGDALLDALKIADELLLRARVPGSIVLMTDTIDPSVIADLDRYRGVNVHILGMAAGAETVPPVDSPPAPPLDESALRRAARALGGSLTRVSIDDSDVRQLASRVEQSFASAPPAEGERWRDDGWWLLWAAALLTLPFFRVGGAVVLK